MTVLSIIVAILILDLMVLVHELGHYSIGRTFKIGILEFAMGMGPKLLKKVKNGITYSLRAFPIGGFVSFLGEDEDHNDPRAMNNQAVYKRFLTILAGPMFNIVFALILAMLMFNIFGYNASQVETVHSGTPAAVSGILPGDIITQVDGKDLMFVNDLTDRIAAADKQVELTILRDGQKMTIQSGVYYNAEIKQNAIGINRSTQFANVRLGFFEAIGYAFNWLVGVIVMMVKFLGNLIFHGQGAGDVAGPVGTVAFIGEAVRTFGFQEVLSLGALISINLGVVNLLPFPAMDGCRLVFLAIEGIFRRPVSRKVENAVHMVGLVVLFGLMILLTINDIGRLGSQAG